MPGVSDRLDLGAVTTKKAAEASNPITGAKGSGFRFYRIWLLF